MTDRELRVELYINPQREQALQQYETMTCHLCGEPMKKYIAHYPHQAHVRCLLRKFGNQSRHSAVVEELLSWTLPSKLPSRVPQ